MVTVIGIHVGVKALDPEAASKFYENIFDLKESNRVTNPGLLFVGNDNEHHYLVFEQARGPVEVSTVNQISIKLPNEQQFLEVKQRLQDRGIVIKAGPFLHRKFPNDSGSLSMYFNDPEGYRIECYVPRENLSADMERRYPIAPY